MKEESPLMIDLPQYRVRYKNEYYSCSNALGRENLKNVLYEASDNYCMYCYNRIKIDNSAYGHLEHAIEKGILENKLTECIPNIGISCSRCNEKFKRIGEKFRRPENNDIKRFEMSAKCNKANCKEACDAYRELKRAYLKKKEAQFLMQPLGVTSEDLGEEGKRGLKLQYNVMETKFVPSTKENYSKAEEDFIKHHIDMFHLNAIENKSTQLICFLEDTIQHDGQYSRLPYNNQVEQLFVDQILVDKEPKETLKICEKLYVRAKLKFYA